MADILIATQGLPSILYASVELARRLAAAGHRVTFAGLREARELAEHHGLAFLPLDPSRYEEFLAADATISTLQRVSTVHRRRQQACRSLAVDGFARAVQDLRPDLVLVNGEMHEHIIAARGAGVPVALLNTFVSIWRQPGLPPPHAFVRPGVGWKGSPAGISLLWLALRARKRGRAWSEAVRRVGCDRVSLLRGLGRGVGLDVRRETDAGQWPIPFTWRHLPVLTLHAWEFEFPHRCPEGAHYVGPMILESRVDREPGATERAALDRILARRARDEGARRLIYAGFGSIFSSDRATVQRLIGVVEGRPAWELVISLSDRVTRADLGPLPDRVHVFSWVPQPRVLRHADVAVTHGGINTIDECVMSGVPTLVYCGGQTDMAGTTARVEQHGIGIAGNRRRDGTPDMRAHIDRLLREPDFARNVRRLQRSYAAYVEDRVAERTVASLLGRQAT